MGRPEEIQCDFCKVSLPGKSEYYLHVTSKHKKDVSKSWFECGQCQLYLPTLYDRNEHRMESHSTKRKPSARVAAKLKNDPELSAKLKCSECEEEFSNLAVLSEHTLSQHKIKDEDESFLEPVSPKIVKIPLKRKTNTPDSFSSETAGLYCPFCLESFSQISELTDHAKEFHNDKQIRVVQIKTSKQIPRPKVEIKVTPVHPEVTSPTLVKKPRITRSPATKTQKTNKVPAVRPESKICEFCSQTLQSDFHLVRHANKYHPKQIKEIWVECETCSLMLPDYEALNTHTLVDHKVRIAKISCDFCKLDFSDKTSYFKHASVKHKAEVAERKWPQCPDCNLHFPNAELLSQHKHNKDKYNPLTSESQTSCCYCSRNFANDVILYNHINMEHKEEIEDHWIKCEECNKYWPSQKDVKLHIERAHKKTFSCRGKKSKNCQFCDRVFCDASEFYRHANLQHKDEIELANWKVCDFCGTYLPSLQVLKNHQTRAHPEPPSFDDNLKIVQRAKRLTQCEFCDKSLCDTSEYYRHANSFHSEELDDWINCDLCDTKLPDETVIRKHKVRVHPGTVEKKLPSVIPRNTDPAKLIPCKFCSDVKLPSVQAFYKHANSDHMDKIKDVWPLCQPCNLRFPTALIMDRHCQKVHKFEKGNSNSCKFCNRPFPRPASLVSHINTFHKDEIRDTWGKCEKCGKYFPSDELLKLHLNRAHSEKKTAEERLQCQFCPALLSTLASFYSHSNDRHCEKLAADGWSLCPHCDQYLPSKDILSNHINHRHGDKKDTPRGKIKSCQFCQRKFHSPVLVYTHIANEHRDLVENDWYLCDKCDIFFPTKLGLTFHMVKGTHGKVRSKENCHFCTNTFMGKPKMYRHANRLHKDQIRHHWVLCDLCNSYMPDENILTSHKINAHNRNMKSGGSKSDPNPAVEMIKCCFCENVFSSNDDYYAHASQEHQDQVSASWKLCEACKLYFPTKKSLKDHNTNHHQELTLTVVPLSDVPTAIQEEQIEMETSEIIVEIEDNLPTAEILTCNICNETFFQSSLFYKHSNQNHLETIADTWHMCPTCKMYFPGLSVLKSHHASDHGQAGTYGGMRITCTYCNETFDKTVDFYWHVNEQHTDAIAPDWFLCDVCNFFFPECDIMLQHKAYFHLEAKTDDI